MTKILCALLLCCAYSDAYQLDPSIILRSQTPSQLSNQALQNRSQQLEIQRQRLQIEQEENYLKRQSEVNDDRGSVVTGATYSSKLSLDRLERIVQGMGLQTKLDEEARFLTIFMGSRAVIATIYNGGSDMGLMAAQLGVRATLQQVNSWNQMIRFGRIVASEKGTPLLTSDLDASEGVTDERVRRFIGTYERNLEYVSSLCKDEAVPAVN